MHAARNKLTFARPRTPVSGTCSAGGEALRGGQSKCFDHELLDFAPIDIGYVEPHPDPTPMPEVGRHKESIGRKCDQCHLFTWWSPKDQRKTPVTMMIDREVGKGLRSHNICNVQALLASRPLRGFRKGRGDSLQSCPAPLGTSGLHEVILADPLSVQPVGCPTSPGLGALRGTTLPTR
jgi:hypothetical protein